CSQTSASAPSSSTINTRRCSAVWAASEIAVRTIGCSPRRPRGTCTLAAHAGGHWPKRAAGPAGVVQGREDVLLGVDDRAEVLVHEVAVQLARQRERERDDAVFEVTAAVEDAAGDL